MKVRSRYFSLFLSFVFFVSPAGAEPDMVSGYNDTLFGSNDTLLGYNDTVLGYNNNTVESGWNEMQNSTGNYFDSGTISGCIATGINYSYGEIVPADGLVEKVTFLTDSPEEERFPVWTPDGNYIMYAVRNDSGNFDSYRMRADGSEIERTGFGEGNLTGLSDINPSGTELILTKSVYSQAGLYLATLDDNRTVTPFIDDPDTSEGWGSWCRLGRKIVYTQKATNSSSQLWIADKTGDNKTRLGTSESVGMGKDWCPLGLRILYSAKDLKEKDDLWLIDLYGTNQTQLTDTPYGEWNPSFSPDGKKIVYVSDEDGKPEIWIRNIEGNYRVKLTNNIGIIDTNPKWSPDGSKIVFTALNLQNDKNNSNSSTTYDFNTTLVDYSNNSVYSNYPVTYSLNNSYSLSNSYSLNNSLVNGSDIALIKLAPSFAVSPIPSVTSVKIGFVNQTFEERVASISITVKNEGSSASEGSISISFPDGEMIKNAEGTGSSVRIYSSGDLIQGKDRELYAQYPLVELVKYNWEREQEENLNITVVPGNESKEIIFLVRTALKNELTRVYSSAPSLSEDLDQQGVEVYRYSMNLSEI